MYDDTDDSGPDNQSEHNTGESWRAATTIADTLRLWPDRVQMLLNTLEPEHPGLEEVHAAVEAENKLEACTALLTHFENNPAGERYRLTQANYSLDAADKCMEDILPASGVWGKTPRLQDGSLDWSYEGPPDYTNNQWHQINRHPWMRHLLFAGLAGEGNRYLEKLDTFIRDWCVHTERHHQFPVDPEIDLGLRVNRKLNAGIRLRDSIWPTIFYSFGQSDHFRDSTRLLMLAALVEHGTFLRHHHNPTGNHMMMQIRGLATLADGFPEFADASEWLRYVQRAASEEAQRQFYPTGVQKELAQNYHSIVVRDFEQLSEIFERNDLTADEHIHEMVRRGTEHLALTMKPNGNCLFFNDANEQSYEWMVRERVEKYDRPDWLYICSNGEEGEEPEVGPSVMYPWSGRLISRSGWDAQTQWSAFDVGPFGWGHQHNDKLHLSVFAHGRDLLVDSGRYTYKDYACEDPTMRRGYVRRSWGHNVILVDHQSQNDDEKIAEEPVKDYRITDNFTYARGTFDQGWYGGHEGSHTRAVVYLTDQFWLVCDQVKLAQPDSIQALWHLHPDCTAQLQDDELVTTDPGRGNLRLSPLTRGDRSWDTDLVSGRTEPTLQGWYSPKQNEIEPSPCGIYETAVERTTQFGWLITTGKDTPPEIDTQLLPSEDGVLRARIVPPGERVTTITVVLDESAPPVELPRGRKLTGQLLIEREEDAPEVACGELLGDGGETLGAHQ